MWLTDVTQAARGIRHRWTGYVACQQDSAVGLGIHRGLVPGPPWIPKSLKAQVPYIQWRMWCLHVTYSHPPGDFKSSLDYLQYLMQCKFYADGCKCYINNCWCTANSSFAFWKFLAFFFFFLSIFSLWLVESIDADLVDTEGSCRWTLPPWLYFDLLEKCNWSTNAQGYPKWKFEVQPVERIKFYKSCLSACWGLGMVCGMFSSSLWFTDICASNYAWVCARLFQSHMTLCDPMDCSPPGSSVHGILLARILEWVANAFLQGIFPTQGWNLHLSCLLHWQASSLPLVPPGKPMSITQNSRFTMKTRTKSLWKGEHLKSRVYRGGWIRTGLWAMVGFMQATLLITFWEKGAGWLNDGGRNIGHVQIGT